TPGLVVTDGALTSLDMTVNGNVTVSGVIITATDLQFQYTAIGSIFAMAGTASVDVTKLGTLTVTFGHGTDPGLVVSNGTLTSLDMTVNGNVTVSGVKITATDLELEYTVTDTDSTFAMSGSASVTVNKLG